MNCVSITPYASAPNLVNKIDIAPCSFCKTSVYGQDIFWGNLRQRILRSLCNFMFKLSMLNGVLYLLRSSRVLNKEKKEHICVCFDESIP